jgi:hypothetical protein
MWRGWSVVAGGLPVLENFVNILSGHLGIVPFIQVDDAVRAHIENVVEIAR